MKAPQPRRRSRSNDGTPNRVTAVLPITPGLMGKLLAEFHEPLQRREPRTFHGPKPAGGSPASSLTDEQVLALRKMRDWHGLSLRQIAEATGLPSSTIDGIVNWRNRVLLDPGPRPAPEEGAA